MSCVDIHHGVELHFDRNDTATRHVEKNKGFAGWLAQTEQLIGALSQSEGRLLVRCGCFDFVRQPTLLREYDFLNTGKGRVDYFASDCGLCFL